MLFCITAVIPSEFPSNLRSDHLYPCLNVIVLLPVRYPKLGPAVRLLVGPRSRVYPLPPSQSQQPAAPLVPRGSPAPRALAPPPAAPVSVGAHGVARRQCGGRRAQQSSHGPVRGCQRGLFVVCWELCGCWRRRRGREHECRSGGLAVADPIALPPGRPPVRPPGPPQHRRCAAVGPSSTPPWNKV